MPDTTTGLAGLEVCDTLTVYNLVDNETDSLSSACACCADPSSGITYSSEFRQQIPRRMGLNFDEICSASHGLSLLLVVTKKTKGGDEEKHVCLFDAGPNPPTFSDNVRKMGVELSAIEHIVLSHYHVDHSGGFRSAVPLIAQARRAANLPPPIVDLHPDYPQSRGIKMETGKILSMIPENPTFDEIKSIGGVVLASKEARAVCGGCFFVSGEIPRVTSYELGLPGHMSKKQGEWMEDPDIADERYMAVNVRGGGLVVFSSCSHAGIVNVCKDAVARAGPEISLFGIMGGFHLAGGPGVEGRVQETVADLVKLDPTVIFPGHCTGWKAKMALSQALPGRVQPAVVGGMYTFSMKTEGTGAVESAAAEIDANATFGRMIK